MTPKALSREYKQLLEDNRWLVKNMWRKNWYTINKIKNETPTN